MGFSQKTHWFRAGKDIGPPVPAVIVPAVDSGNEFDKVQALIHLDGYSDNTHGTPYTIYYNGGTASITGDEYSVTATPGSYNKLGWIKSSSITPAIGEGAVIHLNFSTMGAGIVGVSDTATLGTSGLVSVLFQVSGATLPRIGSSSYDIGHQTPTSQDVYFAVIYNGSNDTWCVWYSDGAIWKMLFVYHYTAAAAYDQINVATGLLTSKFMRYVDYAQWASGQHHTAISGIISSGTTPFTADADGLLYFNPSTAPAAFNFITIKFRIKDANNYYYLEIGSSGQVTLNEVEDGGYTWRASYAGSCIGNYCVLIYDGPNIRLMVGTTIAFNFTTAAILAGADGEIIIPSGAIQEFHSFPRYAYGTAKAEMDAAIGDPL